MAAGGLELKPCIQKTRVDVNGRLYIPGKVRKEMGLRGGEEFEVYQSREGYLIYKLKAS